MQVKLLKQWKAKGARDSRDDRNKTFRENHKKRHIADAKNGWYYYITRFALPLYDNEVKTDIYNFYTVCLVVNCTSRGKMYLYDLVDIKKEASNPLKTDKQPNGTKLLLF